MQTIYTIFLLKNNGIPIEQSLKEVTMTIQERVNERIRRALHTHYVECPWCNGEGGHEIYHYECGYQGCADCDGGIQFVVCKYCDGKKELEVVEEDE